MDGNARFVPRTCAITPPCWRASPVLAGMLRAAALSVASAMFDLSSARVTLLDD